MYLNELLINKQKNVRQMPKNKDDKNKIKVINIIYIFSLEIGEEL